MLIDANRTLVLASASPRRLALLRQIGVEPVIAPADIREYHHITADMDASALVRANAELKARAIAPQYPGALILAADTVVVLDGELLGKPIDDEEAARMLRRLSGRRHQVYTGLCLIDNAAGKTVSGADMTAVRFHELDDAEIAAYVQSGATADKAGSYGLQDAGGLFVAGVEGDHTTVIGLSLSLLRRLMRELSA